MKNNAGFDAPFGDVYLGHLTNGSAEKVRATVSVRRREPKGPTSNEEPAIYETARQQIRCVAFGRRVFPWPAGANALPLESLHRRRPWKEEGKRGGTRKKRTFKKH